MNERIQELAKRAGLEMCSCGCDMPTRQTVEFAELIIQECIDACFEADGIKYITLPSQGQVVFDCVREIRQRWS